MYLGQNIGFAGNGPNSARVAAINARLTGKNTLAHQVLLNGLEHVLDFVFGGATFNRQRSHTGLAHFRHAVVAQRFFRDAISLAQVSLDLSFNGGGELFVHGRRLPVPTRLASFCGQIANGLDHNLHFLVGKQHRTQHLVFRQFLGFRLHHQYGVLRACHDHIQLAVLELIVGGVEHVTGAVIEADARATDGAIERATGNRQGSRGADHCRDIRVNVLVRRHHGTDNLYFVHEAVGEQGADRPVDQARGEGLFFAGAGFTLEKAAGDLAYRVGLFRVMHGQGEKWLARLGALFRHNGNQN